MVTLQGSEDNYFATIPKQLVKSKGWKKGDDIAFMINGGEIMAQAGDILLRKVR